MTENSNPQVASTYLEKNNWDVTVSPLISRKLPKTTSMMSINMISKKPSIVSDNLIKTMILTLMRPLNKNLRTMKVSP